MGPWWISHTWSRDLGDFFRYAGQIPQHVQATLQNREKYHKALPEGPELWEVLPNSPPRRDRLPVPRQRPHRRAGRAAAWKLLVADHELSKGRLVDDGLTAVKAGELLARRRTVVPERTLHRYALEVRGAGRSAPDTTVRVADGEPGAELQVDFAKVGVIDDPASGQRRVVHALIFTAVFSRHCFVRLGSTQATEAVIAGAERHGRSSAGSSRCWSPTTCRR